MVTAIMDSTDYSCLLGPRGSMVLREQHGLRLMIRPQVSAQSSVVTGAMDIIIDSGCCRAMDPDS